MKPVNFYEVMDRKGDVVWGGASTTDAIAWFRRGLDNAIFVSIWDEADPENPHPITDKVEATALVLAAIMSEREKA